MSIQAIENTNNFSLDPNEVSSTTETREILKLKDTALDHLKMALHVYKAKDRYISLCRVNISLFNLLFAPIFWLMSFFNYEHSIEKFKLLQKKLLRKGVDLSIYEPLDLLFDAYSQKKLFSNMTKEQIQLIEKMVRNENNFLLTFAVVFLAIQIIVLIQNRPGLSTLKNISFSQITPKEVFFCQTLLIPFFISCYNYFSRRELEPIQTS